MAGGSRSTATGGGGADTRVVGVGAAEIGVVAVWAGAAWVVGAWTSVEGGAGADVEAGRLMVTPAASGTEDAEEEPDAVTVDRLSSRRTRYPTPVDTP